MERIRPADALEPTAVHTVEVEHIVEYLRTPPSAHPILHLGGDRLRTLDIILRLPSNALNSISCSGATAFAA